jgi:hypothetical protein
VWHWLVTKAIDFRIIGMGYFWPFCATIIRPDCPVYSRVLILDWTRYQIQIPSIRRKPKHFAIPSRGTTCAALSPLPLICRPDHPSLLGVMRTVAIPRSFQPPGTLVGLAARRSWAAPLPLPFAILTDRLTHLQYLPVDTCIGVNRVSLTMDCADTRGRFAPC